MRQQWSKRESRPLSFRSQATPQAPGMLSYSVISSTVNCVFRLVNLQVLEDTACVASCRASILVLTDCWIPSDPWMTPLWIFWVLHGKWAWGFLWASWTLCFSGLTHPSWVSLLLLKTESQFLSHLPSDCILGWEESSLDFGAMSFLWGESPLPKSSVP